MPFINAEPPYLQETRTSENRYREEFTHDVRGQYSLSRSN